MSFETSNKKVYSFKYTYDSKVKPGFHVEGDPKMLKGLYHLYIESFALANLIGVIFI